MGLFVIRTLSMLLLCAYCISSKDGDNIRWKRSVPQVDVACTIYTLAKSCTTLLKDCGPLCIQVDNTCKQLSNVAQIASIACNDKQSMSKSMIFFKDPEVAKANGIKDPDKFWSEVENDPLKVVQMVTKKMIANGGLQVTADQFLGGVDSGISGTSTSLSQNAVGTAVNNEIIGTGGKILDGSLTGEDLVDSGKAIGESVGDGAKELSNGIKSGLDSLNDVDLDNIDEKAEDLFNKGVDTAKDLLERTKNTFDQILKVFDGNSAANLGIPYLLNIILIVLIVHI